LWKISPVNTEFFVDSTLQANVFNNEVLPDPVGPKIAVKEPDLISPVIFERIFYSIPFLLTEKFRFLKNK
jgi:hypothetical protein